MSNSSSLASVVLTSLLAPGGWAALSAEAVVDGDNRHANVGVIMVWRVDHDGAPVELRGFASGTLIGDRVMLTAGHFTAPASALGSIPPSIRIFASFSPTNAKDSATWIPVVGHATHPSMPHCPPPPQCDPTDEILVAPLQPGIADVGLVFLAHSPPGIEPARLAEPGILERFEGAPTSIVGYGTTTPAARQPPIDLAAWDGKRRVRTSTVRRVVDETWALWSLPSFVCHGDSGGAIFLRPTSESAGVEVLVANVSDGGKDCRSHNNNNRLDTPAVQEWIEKAIRERGIQKARPVSSKKRSDEPSAQSFLPPPSTTGTVKRLRASTRSWLLSSADHGQLTMVSPPSVPHDGDERGRAGSTRARISLRLAGDPSRSRSATHRRDESAARRPGGPPTPASREASRARRCRR